MSRAKIDEQPALLSLKALLQFEAEAFDVPVIAVLAGQDLGKCTLHEDVKLCAGERIEVSYLDDIGL